MRRRSGLRPIVTLGWVFVALAISVNGQSASPPEAVRRALLVGIDHYIPIRQGQAGRSAGPVGNLEGSSNDVDAIRDVLVARYGFQAANVHILRDADATRDRILGELGRWLVDQAAPGDVSFFYYAGHGSQVRNSKSLEADKLDETIVPADANLGRPDIRDKELAALFDRALDRNVQVTAIFDSCHSGSIARGILKPTLVRSVAPDLRDIADPLNPVPPEARGALILSAAQDLESANEILVPEEDNAHHGLFTWALAKTLRTMPVNQPAEYLFQSVRALMQASEEPQEPVLAATDERRGRALFDQNPAARGSAITAAVQSMQPDGSVVLAGGRAAGIRIGAELQSSAAPRVPAVTLRVVEQAGMSLSRAEVVAGKTSDVQNGMLFSLSKWAAPSVDSLRVWTRPFQSGVSTLSSDAAALSKIAADPRLIVADDPLIERGTPATTLERSDDGWRLVRPDESTIALGRMPPDANTLVAVIAPDASGLRRVRFDLPLPAEASSALSRLLDASGVVLPETSIDHAEYVLVGRARDGRLEFSWMRPLTTSASTAASVLPTSTPWLPLTGDPDAFAERLSASIIPVATVRGWLTLETPPDNGSYPYHLALEDFDTGVVNATGTARDGQWFGLALTIDQTIKRPEMTRRFIYVFDLDGSTGRKTLLFPRVTSGNVENDLPIALDERGQLPTEIRLGDPKLFRFHTGVDTLVLLTTGTPLADPTVLDDAASGLSRSASGARDGLSVLLSQGGTARRGIPSVTPTDWSVERITIRTAGATVGP